MPARRNKILIIDDEIIIARELQRIISAFDIHSEIAISPEELDSIVVDFHPDLILCDIKLESHQIDGIDLMMELRKRLAFQVIFVSAYTNESYLNRIKQLHPVNYIVKPFSDDQVKVVVQFALEQLRKNEKTVTLLQELNDTQRQILIGISEGKTTGQIAEGCNLSPKTIENQRSKICKILDLPSQKNSLVMWVLQNM